MIIASMSIWHR